MNANDNCMLRLLSLFNALKVIIFVGNRPKPNQLNIENLVNLLSENAARYYAIEKY
jgi:hypothetical protein